MFQNTLKHLAGPLLVVVALGACASTKPMETWVDERYRGKPVSNILVIGVTDENTIRRTFENRFVARLKAAGVNAVSSADAVSTSDVLKLDKDAILRAVAKYSNDSVLITRLMGVEEKKAYHPPQYYGGFYGYYGHYYTLMHSPGYYTSHTFYRLETVLYDVRTEKPIWSVLSRTWNPESDRQMIAEVIAVAIQDMKKNQLIP